MKRYYFYYITNNYSNTGANLGYWSSCFADNKKEVLKKYNTKGYARHIKKVYTEEQFIAESINNCEAERYLKRIRSISD